MDAHPEPTPGYARRILAALSGLMFTLFVMGLAAAFKEIAVQDWDGQGSGWLKLQYWAQQVPWKEGIAGGGAALVAALALQRITLVRWATNFFGSARGLILCTALVLSPCVVATLSRPSAPPSAPNVLFVLVDTVRADHVSFLGYERETWPELGRLAESGAVFERALTQAPWTKPTVATLFTSLVPSKHGAMSHMPMESGRRFVAMGREHRTLAESLAANGWETAAVAHNANIQPVYGFGQGFDDFHFIEDWNLRAPTMINVARDWIGERDGDRPWFMYLHLTDPHYPYDAPPAPDGPGGMWDKSGSDFVLNYEVIKGFHDGEWEPTAELRQHLYDAYDEELLYTDQQLAPFMEQVMKEHPNTVVVLVGDHGDELWEHDSLGHGHVVYDELVHVPLVMWGAYALTTEKTALPGSRVSGQVRLLDVSPTLLDLCGLTDPNTGAYMGESLLAMIRNDPTRNLPAPFETGGDGEPPWQLRGISAQHGGQLWKLIRQEHDFRHQEVGSKLFNLSTDPLELNDVAADNPEVVEALFSLMQARGWYTKPEDMVGELFNADQVDSNTLQNLHDIGYGDFDDE